MIGVVDNDILLKLASYRLFGRLLHPNSAPSDFGILGAAKYVLGKAIQEGDNEAGADELAEELQGFIRAATSLEPTEAEQEIAASLELAAQQKGVALDAGESQLCAVTISRGIARLFTGDKRAIQALEQLLDSREFLIELCGKIVCLEELVRDALSDETYASIQLAICSEPKADKVLAICFKCVSGNGSYPSTTECLDSYINDLQSKAPRIYPRLRLIS